MGEKKRPRLGDKVKVDRKTGKIQVVITKRYRIVFRDKSQITLGENSLEHNGDHWIGKRGHGGGTYHRRKKT